MTHDEALKSPLGKYLLRYCYCGPAAAGAPSSDTCRIHYALAGIDPVLKEEVNLQNEELLKVLVIARKRLLAEPPLVAEAEFAIHKALEGAEKQKDGLQLGESRNLPHPKPISNDAAIKRTCEHCGQIQGFPHSPGCKNEPESVKFR